jgi:hypothetical protein
MPDSTGSTATAGPLRMLIISSQASVSQWVLGANGSLALGCQVFVRVHTDGGTQDHPPVDSTLGGVASIEG